MFSKRKKIEKRKLIVNEKFYPKCVGDYFDLEIYKVGFIKYEVIITQPKDRSCNSVTNLIENLATEILEKYLGGVWPNRIRWVEHWHPCSTLHGRLANRVRMKWKWTELRYIDPEWYQGIKNLESVHA